MMRYARKEDYQFRVVIDNEKEWEFHWEILRWCVQAFGDNTHCVTWEHALSGSPSRGDPEFSTWLFMREEDATMFRLAWG